MLMYPYIVNYETAVISQSMAKMETRLVPYIEFTSARGLSLEGARLAWDLLKIFIRLARDTKSDLNK